MNGVFDNLFGIFSLACGAYLLYAYYQLKFKREINTMIMLPKDVSPKKCKDLNAYCKKMEMPTLLLAFVVIIYGGIDIYNTQTGGGAKFAFLTAMLVVFLGVIGYAMTIKKVNSQYFGIR